MTDPKKSSSAPHTYDFDSHAFQRIQVNQPSKPESREYQDLPRNHQQELLARLIDHVREL